MDHTGKGFFPRGKSTGSNDLFYLTKVLLFGVRLRNSCNYKIKKGIGFGYLNYVFKLLNSTLFTIGTTNLLVISHKNMSFVVQDELGPVGKYPDDITLMSSLGSETATI